MTSNRPAILFAALAAAMAATCAFQGVLLSQVSAATKQQTAAAVWTNEVSAYAKCGAYDVTVTAHDAASVGDAREAAFEYFDRCTEVGSGVAKAG